MRYLVAVLTLLVAISGQALGKIAGATIESAACRSNRSTIVISNQSSQDITGYSLDIVATVNGHATHWEHVEDYGPMVTAAGKALHPGDTATVRQTFGGIGKDCTGITAKLIVVIYRDQTAEVENQASFEHTLAVRARIAKALRLESDTLTASLAKPNPSAEAKANLEQQLSEARDRAKASGGESDTDESYMQRTIALLRNAPVAVADQRNLIEGEAARLNSEASLFSAYAQVRRLP